MPKQHGIYKRKDGRYSTELYLGHDPATGKTRRKTIYGKTAREVKEKCAELRRDADRGRDLTAKTQTVEAWILTWIDQSVAPHRKPATLRLYRYAFEHHIAPAIGRIGLADLRPHHVQQMMNDLMQRGLSAATLHHTRKVLRTALHAAAKNQLVMMNAASHVELPPLPRSRGRALTTDQARTLLDAVEGHRLAGLYHLAFLGLRQGELIALRWADIDFDTGILTIQQGKTVNAHRQIPLPETLLDRLAQHYTYQQTEQAIYGPDWNPRKLLFPSRRGTPLLATVVWRHFKHLLARCGLPDMRFHDLRHSASTLMQAAGVPVRVVADLLGHSSDDITAEIYTHTYHAEYAQAVKYLDDLVKKR